MLDSFDRQILYYYITQVGVNLPHIVEEEQVEMGSNSEKKEVISSFFLFCL